MFEKVPAWQKNFGTHTSKYPKEVDRAKAKEPSLHQIKLGNKSGVFTTETKKRTNRKGFRHNKLSKLSIKSLKVQMCKPIMLLKFNTAKGN